MRSSSDLEKAAEAVEAMAELRTGDKALSLEHVPAPASSPPAAKHSPMSSFLLRALEVAAALVGSGDELCSLGNTSPGSKSSSWQCGLSWLPGASSLCLPSKTNDDLAGCTRRGQWRYRELYLSYPSSLLPHLNPAR